MFVIVFIIILTILVLVHELGHFIAAKKNGVKVDEFGIGFPPRLFGFKWGETLYSINALPLGGFVKVYGEEYHEEKETEIDPKLKSRAFVYKKPWQKAIILVAGIIGNFLLAWVLISFLFTQGVPVPTDHVIVENVQKGSPADTAGIKPGDTLVSIIKDDKTYPIKSGTDLISLAKQFGDQEITLIVNKNNPESKVNPEYEVQVTPRKNPPKGQGALGVAITSFIETKYPWYQAPFYGLKHAFTITYKIFVELTKTLVQFVTFQKPQVEVAGPIGIAQFTGQAIKLGNNAVLELMALLSLNLAVINILPFPALDGGRLAFVVYEWVTKKRPNQDIEKYFNIAGFALLMLLTVLITFHDIMKIVSPK